MTDEQKWAHIENIGRIAGQRASAEVSFYFFIGLLGGSVIGVLIYLIFQHSGFAMLAAILGTLVGMGLSMLNTNRHFRERDRLMDEYFKNKK